MKILYVTTIGGTMGFFTSIIEVLLKSGHTVDVATNLNIGMLPDCYHEWGCRVYPISCTRSPFNKGTLTAIREIRQIVREGSYDIVHRHTPIAAMCTRFATRTVWMNLRRQSRDSAKSCQENGTKHVCKDLALMK